MKDFLKFTLASLIGVILAGIVLTILGLITVVGMVASSDSETIVKDNSVFVLDLKGNLSERVQENPFQQIMGDDNGSYGLNDILSSIKKAKENDKIKGIYIQPSYLATSFASLEEIRNALQDFKESGKFIVAYADQYTQGMYYLASVADKVIINPQGNISWHGLASQPVFFKDLLDKLGIDVQVFKVGTYKSAVEPFIATEMSPANREQVTVFLNSIWNQLLDDVIVLTGTEIKSIRMGKASLVDTYCYFVHGELWVKNMHIAEYFYGSYNNHTARRERKLLLSKKELRKLEEAGKNPGFTIVPVRLFLNEKGLAKLVIALAKGKKQYDKRESLREKDDRSEMDRMFKR